jgi:hypothetical protein
VGIDDAIFPVARTTKEELICPTIESVSVNVSGHVSPSMIEIKS